LAKQQEDEEYKKKFQNQSEEFKALSKTFKKIKEIEKKKRKNE
jgi:hypothetical protein